MQARSITFEPKWLAVDPIKGCGVRLEEFCRRSFQNIRDDEASDIKGHITVRRRKLMTEPTYNEYWDNLLWQLKAPTATNGWNNKDKATFLTINVTIAYY